MTPTNTPNPTEPKPIAEITLEEWIEATQSCCGIDWPDDEPPDTPPNPADQP